MQYKHRYRFLVVIKDANVNVCEYEKSRIDQPFISFQPKHIFIGKSKFCAMTEF